MEATIENGWITVFGRNIGVIVGKTLLCKKDSRRHLLRKHNGYGLSIIAMQTAISMGASQIQIDVIDKNETLMASFDDFIKYGIDFSNEGGHDKQKVLPLEYFERTKIKPGEII